MGEQTFVADYAFQPLREPGGGDAFDYWLKHDSGEAYVGTDLRGPHALVEALSARGIPLEKRPRGKRVTPVRTDFALAFERMKESLRTRCAMAGYSTGIIEHGMVWIHTPTTLGVEEHMARRAIVERFFREWSVPFVLDCATKHSDTVCKPLTLAPELAPLIPAAAQGASP